MAFEGEDVLLEEDILKQKEKFIKTWSEYAASNFDQIIKSSYSMTSASTIHTVSKNHTLFITGVHFSLQGVMNAPTGACLARVWVTEGGTVLYNLLTRRIITQGVEQNANMTLTFPMPIKVFEGASVQVTTGTSTAGLAASGGITGFEVSKRII